MPLRSRELCAPASAQDLLANDPEDFVLEREPGVIEADGHLHANSAFAFLTTFSTEKPSSFKTTSPGADAP